MSEDKKVNKKYLYVTITGIILFVILVISTISGFQNNDDRDRIREQAIEHENYLLQQMQPIQNNYSITNRNQEEIILSNYSLGSVDIYNKAGTSIGGFLINNQTVYHNWYEIEKNDSGMFDINILTVDRQESEGNYANGHPYIIHDRALTINLSPYNNLLFASADGTLGFRNTSYETENSYKIKYDVKIGVSQFEMTRILSINKGAWNSSHTDQFCTYEIQLVRISFDDETYESGSIMEYRFTAQSFVSDEYDLLYASYLE